MAQQAQGFFEMLKVYFAQLIDKIKRSEFNIFQMVLAFGGGCLLGFILKRYSNLLFSFALFMVGLLALNYFNYVSFNLNSSLIESTFGFKPVPLNSEGLAMVWAWAKFNAGLSISFIIGMVMGLKLA